MATDRVKHLYSHAKYGHYHYDHRTDCDWVIEAPLGKNVHLSFLSFQLEYETECGYDFVEVFSGLDASSPPYGRFCGNSVSMMLSRCSHWHYNQYQNNGETFEFFMKN